MTLDNSDTKEMEISLSFVNLLILNVLFWVFVVPVLPVNFYCKSVPNIHGFLLKLPC